MADTSITSRPKRSNRMEKSTASTSSPYFEQHSDLESGSSGHEFQSAPKRRKQRRYKAVKGRKRVKMPICVRERRRSTGKPLLEPTHSDDSNSSEDNFCKDDWEDVAEQEITDSTKELDFMNQMFEAASECPLASESLVENMVISVNINSKGSKKIPSDPEAIAALQLAKSIREKYYAMHLCHVATLLTQSRFANKSADHCLVRSLGFSFVSGVKEIYDAESGVVLPPYKWTVSHLRATVLHFITQVSQLNNIPGSRNFIPEAMSQRLQDDSTTKNDLTILFIAALRSIGLDTRLVAAFQPIPLRLADSPKNLKKVENTLLKSQLNSAITSENDLVLFSEVYLSGNASWVAVDLQLPVGRVDEEFFLLPYHYFVGFSSVHPLKERGETSNEDELILPYASRSPIDLASRYDSAWMDTSKSSRLSDSVWNILLQTMRNYCDLDGQNNLRRRDTTKQPEVRDFADKQRILCDLRRRPLPNRVQYFKNHPLYALKRHLLKFEVIYPPDAMILGYLKVGKSEGLGEPIFSRDCVYLCHTRESWLKVAKTVRVGEKPAKVVTARMSLKRKLLQDACSPPPTVEVFGCWQVDDYKPPIAVDGVVPRNEHGNVELFQPCMLPIGCTHICLSGIQHIAKRLGIDASPAMVGWSFHGAGWAHPEYNGYVVCQESVPALLDAWRQEKMNKDRAALADRLERVLANWRKLTQHLLLWQHVEARFQQSRSAHVSVSTPFRSRGSRRGAKVRVGGLAKGKKRACIQPIKAYRGLKDEMSDNDGWQHLDGTAQLFPRLMEASELPMGMNRNRKSVVGRKKGKQTTASKRPRKKRETSSSSSHSAGSSGLSQFLDSS